ncbi:MAG TPA: response regulator [Polyangia bacterium]|jgi:DNA-binding NtrC family response regulator|nr:response regulator [Polyangia bacterium]
MNEMSCEIVLVDDDAEFATSLAEILTLEGHKVDVFETPEAAFEWLLGGGQARLVLLDLHTSGMSAQRFRALQMSAPALNDLSIVIVSGEPTIHEVATSLDAMDAFEKPIDIARLLETVRRHCRSA